ncbi:uncharacterized protein LOC122534935 isoform X2 [Frieseomelitta varia]|uniref:uncharacterized protein LOC122534935 isoform X2 n=1 Tax=Frieseomelitta varia TaxID=561572 RepID=UPI001CB6A4C3|nr:uncharacterized protein LOC122534935 isoform X2 [Frieseomelitta varia]
MTRPRPAYLSHLVLPSSLAFSPHGRTHGNIRKYPRGVSISRHAPCSEKWLRFESIKARTLPSKTIYKSEWFIASKIGSSSRNFRNSHVSRRTGAFARGEYKDMLVPIPTIPHSLHLARHVSHLDVTTNTLLPCRLHLIQS